MSPAEAELLRRLAGARAAGARIVGITGAPGAGKSTLSARLATATGAVVVPMDGFHRPSAELRRLGLLERKGEPDSFDSKGFVALLRRLRAATGAVTAPGFDRVSDQPVADAITVPAGSLVLTEGNYLLLDSGSWADVRGLLDAVWFVEVPEPVRIARLVARHVEFGRSPAEALARASSGSDADNARLVAATRDRADLVISGD